MVFTVVEHVSQVIYKSLLNEFDIEQKPAAACMV